MPWLPIDGRRLGILSGPEADAGDPMMRLIAPLLLLGALAVAIGSVVAIARWILRPLDQAAKGRQAPAQFTLVDFLCLVFMAQLPTGLVQWMFYGSGSEQGAALGICVFAWIACGLLWWTAIRTLGRAGIHGTWHRAGFLALVLPTTIFGIIAFLPLSFAVWAAAFSGEVPRRGLRFGLAILAEGGLIGALYACARYTRWLVASAPRPDGQARPSSSNATVPR